MKESRPKIVIVHNIIAPYKIVLFNELAKIVPNLFVVFISENEQRRDWIIDYSKINFSYSVIFDGNIDGISIFKMAKETWRMLNKLQPNSLIICDYSKIFGWAALLWGILRKSKLVFWLDSTKDDRNHYFPKEQIKNLFLRNFKLFLSPGLRTQEYLEYMGVKNNKIINTGYAVDNSFYSQEIETLTESGKLSELLNVPTDKNFLYVGRFSEEKNINLLLNVFNRLSKTNRDWGLILLGDGPQKNIIEQFITKNNLENRISLCGFVQQSKIVKYYLKADVFILPSKSEPWGLVVNEALLCGLPIIVSNKCGCTPELVEERKNGFTFNPYNQNELEKIMTDITKGKYNLNEFGKESLKIIQNHSPQIVAAKVNNALNKYNIINNNK